MTDSRKSANMVILDRPMISVETTEYKEVKLTVVGMDAAMESIRQQEIVFPLECATQVAQFLQQVAGQQDENTGIAKRGKAT
ncbi:hypothetical protein LG201_05400 [Methylobacillus gramineus]|uniref:hypothetical protein n=1 Tax=Methylobacillus gramineus TaxID=755169 RepID=UPI001CFFE374|nr:hypothetical protein [Methylobacillus gramineus]MCB5184636.1 hypothetical protein [Methylobacillus gramineus]